jgi:hypothetical protein
VRCPAGQASLAGHSGGAGAPPGSTKRPCQELADDRKAQAKRLRLLLPRRFPSAGMERGRKRREDRRRGTYGESAARRSASHRKWRAERRPPRPATDADAIGLRFSARHPFEGTANPGCFKCIAATKEHARMPRRHSYLPARGRYAALVDVMTKAFFAWRKACAARSR